MRQLYWSSSGIASDQEIGFAFEMCCSLKRHHTSRLSVRFGRLTGNRNHSIGIGLNYILSAEEEASRLLRCLIYGSAGQSESASISLLMKRFAFDKITPEDPSNSTIARDDRKCYNSITKVMIKKYRLNA